MWLHFLFACLNFLIKLRCEFIILYSFTYCSNGFCSHIKYLDYLVSFNSNTFYVKEARFKNFLLPWWWTLPYHYLSFIPLCPLFDGIVFECLWDIVSEIGPTVDGRFALSSRKIDHWLEIEDSLMVVSHLLDKGFFTRLQPSLTPIPPSILGFYKKTFSSLQVTHLCIAASRDLFLLWMTPISNKITAIETVHEDWFSYLVEHKCLQDWVSAVQSMICDFSWHCPHVGTFLNIQNPQPQQPSVEWFYSWDIPVWYIPGGGNPELAHLQPPPHILQMVMTFILKAPSSLWAPSPSPTLEYSSLEYEKVQRAYIATRPWEVFFAACKVHRQEFWSRKLQKSAKPVSIMRRSPKWNQQKCFTGIGVQMELLSLFALESATGSMKMFFIPIFSVNMMLCSIPGMSATTLDLMNLMTTLSTMMAAAMLALTLKFWMLAPTWTLLLMMHSSTSGLNNLALVDFCWLLLHPLVQELIWCTRPVKSMSLGTYPIFMDSCPLSLFLQQTQSRPDKKNGKNVWSWLASRQTSIPATLVSLVLLWTSSSTCKEMVHKNLNGTYHQEIGSL